MILNFNTVERRMFMTKTFLLIILFFGINTSVIASPESPEFVRTKEWRINRLASGNILLTTKAVFYNPNKTKAKLTDIILNIFANDKLIGTVTQIEKIKIHGNSSFDIPLSLEFNLKDSDLDLFGSLLSLMSNKMFLIDIIGYVKMNVFCIPFKVQVDEKQELSVKDFIK